jgi:mRNA interferase YafQ
VPSKKAPTKKKPKLPLIPEYSKLFSKDWTRLEHSGACNMERLKNLMLLLIADDGPLPEVHLEHELKGEWAGYLECHMGGDVLLIYTRGFGKIVFARAGSHATLFKDD